jgi:sterol desaturase/sphingolipid hydroxylase (fatty acid hydroxylase superfamily)
MSVETAMAQKAAVDGSAAVSAEMASLSARSEAESTSGLPRLTLDLIFTALLIGLLLLGALKLWPTVPGTPQRPLGAILIATLLPFGSLTLLSVIERLFAPAGPRKSFKTWFFHLQINIFWSFVAGFTFTFVAIWSDTLAKHFGFHLGLIDLRFAGGKGLLALIGAAWLTLIAGDLVFYGYHRLAHKVPFLWQLHKLHHMDPELDVLTVNRDNWLDAVYAAITLGIPSGILFKLDDLAPWQLGLLSGSIVTIFTTLLTLGHMNVRLQVGKASLFYCSPQVHRIHHSRLPHHFDKNFAFILPLWDVLFGTYYAPARDEFPPTGVPDEREITSFWEAELFTLCEWWKMFRGWRERKTHPNL